MLGGILAVLASSFLYGIMPIFTKSILASGMSPQSVVCFRFLFAGLFCGAVIFYKRFSVRVTRRQLVELVLYGFLGFGMTAMLLTLSYQQIPTGLATMFHFTYPMFVAAIMTVLFHERVTVLRLVACAAAICGLVAMTDFSGGLSARGVLFAILSGITYAIYVVANRRSSICQLPILVIIFYVTMLSSSFFGIAAAASAQLTFPPNLRIVLLLMIVAILCTVFSLFLLTMGIQRLGATTASVLNMAEPLTSIVAGAVLLGETLGLNTLVGCVLIICSALLISADARFSHQFST